MIEYICTCRWLVVVFESQISRSKSNQIWLHAHKPIGIATAVWTRNQLMCAWGRIRVGMQLAAGVNIDCSFLTEKLKWRGESSKIPVLGCYDTSLCTIPRKLLDQYSAVSSQLTAFSQLPWCYFGTLFQLWTREKPSYLRNPPLMLGPALSAVFYRGYHLQWSEGPLKSTFNHHISRRKVWAWLVLFCRLAPKSCKNGLLQVKLLAFSEKSQMP